MPLNCDEEFPAAVIPAHLLLIALTCFPRRASAVMNP
jgi:hypothetical protein